VKQFFLQIRKLAGCIVFHPSWIVGINQPLKCSLWSSQPVLAEAMTTVWMYCTQFEYFIGATLILQTMSQDY